MLKSLLVRASQGTQYISDLRKASPVGFRGRPHISDAPCTSGCDACVAACPTVAIALGPVRLDLATCTFCNECVAVCPAGKISFTPEPRMASDSRTGLVVAEGDAGPAAVTTSAALRKLFGRSLRLRQVSAGGCSACELELNALANVNFDLQRFGIEWVASPRHADALVLTGPLTKNMADAVRLAWDAMPDPKFLIGFGACAISGGLYAEASAVDRGFFEDVGPALWIPGCPPHPLTFVHGVLDLLGVGRASG